MRGDSLSIKCPWARGARQPARPNDDERALIRAAREGDADAVERMLDAPDVDPAANDNEALCLAAEFGHMSALELLLADDRVDAMAREGYALRFASWRGHVDVVHRLLDEPRIDPSARRNWLVCWAACDGHADVLRRVLADDRVDPAVDDNFPLKSALLCSDTNEGCRSAVEVLLEDDRVRAACTEHLYARVAERGFRLGFALDYLFCNLDIYLGGVGGGGVGIGACELIWMN